MAPLLARLLLITAVLVQPAWGMAALTLKAGGCGQSSAAACACCREGSGADEVCCCRGAHRAPTSNEELVGWNESPEQTAQVGIAPALANAPQDSVPGDTGTMVQCPCFAPQPIPHETERARGNPLGSFRLPLGIAGSLPADLPTAARRLVSSISVAAGESHFTQRHFGVWRL